MTRKQAHLLALRNIFVSTIARRGQADLQFVELDDEIARRLQTLGGLASAW